MSIWAKLNDALESAEVSIDEFFTSAEKKLIQTFEPLFKQIESSLGTQGIQIVEDAFTAVATTVVEGGNIGAGISAAAAQALGQIENDAKSDVKNAVYGLLAAKAATVPAPAITPANTNPPVVS